ncbi:MAG: hypothetical protein MJB57_16660 [Gemmatimonadetes bacterium]|nr:hypothetical protein [Gemmatimonadota bacterium]
MKKKADWPRYLEPLRPDEVTAQRMRRRILDAAGALRARSWFDVTAGWSSLLAPLAAGVLVVFGALAYRAADRDEPIPVATNEPSGELVPSLAPDAEAPPALLIDAVDPSRDAVLTAALVTPQP